MGLNIKNPGVEENIRKLAAQTGESLTDAIDTAVREKLARIEEEKERARPARSVEEFLTAIRPFQDQIAYERRRKGDTRTARELMDELYDEHGLPD
jgi:antitoxin VapB